MPLDYFQPPAQPQEPSIFSTYWRHRIWLGIPGLFVPIAVALLSFPPAVVAGEPKKPVWVWIWQLAFVMGMLLVAYELVRWGREVWFQTQQNREWRLGQKLGREVGSKALDLCRRYFTPGGGEQFLGNFSNVTSLADAEPPNGYPTAMQIIRENLLDFFELVARLRFPEYESAFSTMAVLDSAVHRMTGDGRSGGLQQLLHGYRHLKEDWDRKKLAALVASANEFRAKWNDLVHEAAKSQVLMTKIREEFRADSPARTG